MKNIKLLAMVMLGLNICNVYAVRPLGKSRCYRQERSQKDYYGPSSNDWHIMSGLQKWKLICSRYGNLQDNGYRLFVSRRGNFRVMSWEKKGQYSPTTLKKKFGIIRKILPSGEVESMRHNLSYMRWLEETVKGLRIQ